MGEERYANHPLLYIHQPEMEEVHVTMQHHYRTSTFSADEETDGLRSDETSTAVYSHEEDTDDPNQLKQKKFREMTVEEQLAYLTEQPEYVPKIVCEIHTENRLHQGIIQDVKEGIVTVLSGSRKVEIPQEEITQIRIYSF